MSGDADRTQLEPSEPRKAGAASQLVSRRVTRALFDGCLSGFVILFWTGMTALGWLVEDSFLLLSCAGILTAFIVARVTRGIGEARRSEPSGSDGTSTR